VLSSVIAQAVASPNQNTLRQIPQSRSPGS